MLRKHGLHFPQTVPVNRFPQTRQITLRIPHHVLPRTPPFLRPHHRIGIHHMTLIVQPPRMRRVAHVTQRMQPARRKGHHREKRPAHHRHTHLTEFARHLRKTQLGQFMPQLHRRKPCHPQIVIHPRIGTVEYPPGLQRLPTAQLHRKGFPAIPAQSSHLASQPHLHPLSLEHLPRQPRQFLRIKGIFLHGKHLFDQFRRKQLPPRPPALPQRSAHPLHDRCKLRRIDLREPPRHRVELLKTIHHRTPEGIHEDREIDMRPQGRQQTPRIMVPIVHPRLVMIGRTPQQTIAHLAEHHPGIRFPQPHRCHAAKESAANHQRTAAAAISIHRYHAHSFATASAKPSSPRGLRAISRLMAPA